MLGDRLLKFDTYVPRGGGNPCDYCQKNQSLPIWEMFCHANESVTAGWTCEDSFLTEELQCVQGMPGLASGIISGVGLFVVFCVFSNV